MEVAGVDSEIPEYLRLLDDLSTKVWEQSADCRSVFVNTCLGGIDDTTRDKVKREIKWKRPLHQRGMPCKEIV